MPREFIPPDWLEGQDAESIQRRMMERLPADIDDTEGGFPFDFTMPTALEKAELLQFHAIETLKIMFPQWSYGRWLEEHAAPLGITRKPPSAAYGIVTVTGIPGTEIPAGFAFAVPAVCSAPSIGFITEEDATIGEDGTVDIGVIAKEPGTSGNVKAGSITIMETPMKGITEITNREKTSGGTLEEDDEGLRQRIEEKEQSGDTSNVGNDADYIRWAKEVPGVGDVFVIPQWNPDVPNSVKVVVMDANGEPANAHILAEVYNHIMSPDNRIDRLAPVGAILTVVAPSIVPIAYAMKATLRPGYDAATVRSDIDDRIRAYYVSTKDENVVKYNEIHAIITDAAGIYDFTGLTLNGDTANIKLERDEYPITGSIDLGLPEEASE